MQINRKIMVGRVGFEPTREFVEGFLQVLRFDPKKLKKTYFDRSDWPSNWISSLFEGEISKSRLRHH